MLTIIGVMSLILLLIAAVAVVKWIKRNPIKGDPDPDIIDRDYYDSLR